MKFDDLDKQLRIFETEHDHCVLPGIFMVARIDGRSFTKLTKEKMDFDAPFDKKFRDLMVMTVEHLMNCGFNISYGFTESDEISLLFDLYDNSFGRKTRKLNSILAGEASAIFSLNLGVVASFDCRISELPKIKNVVDYFRWRNEDAHRNALNSHCYWKLRNDGRNAKDATNELLGLSNGEKNELLFKYGLNFNDVPNWQKRGIGLYWEQFEKTGWNPQKEIETKSIKRKMKIDYDLPMKDEYSNFIEKFITE